MKRDDMYVSEFGAQKRKRETQTEEYDEETKSSASKVLLHSLPR